jgi:hypothetical protein
MFAGLATLNPGGIAAPFSMSAEATNVTPAAFERSQSRATTFIVSQTASTAHLLAGNCH